MEQRQRTQNSITLRKREDLAELSDIRGDIVMRQHNALRLARVAAGKDDRRGIVNVGLEGELRHRRHHCPDFLAYSYACSEILSKQCISRYLQRHTFEKCFRRDDRLKSALP